MSCARNQCSASRLSGIRRAHLRVDSVTTTGCRTTMTKRASGKVACRKRVITRLGGLFSTSTGRSVSQCGSQAPSSAARAVSPASGEASVRCAPGSKANRPGPPNSRAAG